MVLIGDVLIQKSVIKGLPVITTDRTGRLNADIINKLAASDAITMEPIAVRFICRNVLWPAIVPKQDMICLTVVLVMEMSHPSTERITAVRQDIHTLTAPAP